MYYKGKKLESYLGKLFKTETSKMLRIKELNNPEMLTWDAHYAVGDQISHFGETIDDFKKRVLSMYSMNKGRKKGYKWVCVKAKIKINGTTLPVYIPTIAEVSIPHNHIVFHGEYNKCRTDSATIERVNSIPEFMYMRNAKVSSIFKDTDYFDGVDAAHLPCFIDVSHTMTYNSVFDNPLKFGVCNYVSISSDGKEINTIINTDGLHDDMVCISNIDYDYTYSLYQLERSHEQIFTYYHPFLAFAFPVGERIIVKDFDIMPVTCTRGFHFFECIDHAFEYFNM